MPIGVGDPNGDLQSLNNLNTKKNNPKFYMF